MELDEMKNAWQQLDARLKEQEALRINIIREMLYAKSEKMQRRLSRYDWYSLFLLILVSPCILMMFECYKTTPLQIVIDYIVLVLYTSGFFFQIWLVYLISKVDVRKPMSENVKHVLKYKITVQWGKLSYIIIPVMLVLIFETVRIMPFFRAKVIFYSAAVFLLILSGAAYIWYYKVFYKNIDRLLDSLKEIKELEKDDE